MQFIVALLLFLFTSCNNTTVPSSSIPPKILDTDQASNKVSTIVAEGNTIETRFSPLPNYERVSTTHNYATYLRNLRLLPDKSLVKYYNGDTKSNFDVYAAVIDHEIGSKNLHQCADAIMRIQADYYYQNGAYDKIHFNLTNGFRVDYTKWQSGYRVKVKGNSTNWYKATTADSSYATYWKYLEFIFTYAGTLSLSKELVPVSIHEMQIGDVFIQGGSPGHAVLVMDMIVNKEGNKAYLLGQSYMPAQQMQILLNPKSQENSPWYILDENTTIPTPEWTFDSTQLMRFKND